MGLPRSPHRGPEAEPQGWVGAGPLSQTPLGTEAGGSPCPGLSLVMGPEGQQTDAPRTWDASPVLLVPAVKVWESLQGSYKKELAGQPPSTLLRGKPASVHSDGNKSPAPRPRPGGPACPCPRPRPTGHLWEGGQAPGRFLGALTSGRTRTGPRGQLWAGPWLARLPVSVHLPSGGPAHTQTSPASTTETPTRLPVWAGVGTRRWLPSRGMWVLSGTVSFGLRGVCQGLQPQGGGVALSRGTVSVGEVRRCKLLPRQLPVAHQGRWAEVSPPQLVSRPTRRPGSGHRAGPGPWLGIRSF